jgi:hypothetical protein
MALVLADRVQETSTSTGTGTFTLAGAVSGYQSFAVIGDGNLTYYTIADQSGPNWEVGLGIYTLSGTTLTRVSVFSNSNGNTSLVNFPAGTKTVFVTYPAEKSVNVDTGTNVILPGNLFVENGQLIADEIAGSGSAPGSNNRVTLTASTGATLSSLTDGVVKLETGTTGAVNKTFTFDSNGNTTFSNFIAGFTAITAAAGTTVLTVASTRTQVLVGSTTQTIRLPDATTLQLGHSFIFVNNSSGVLTITNNASATIDIVPSGGAVQIGATSIATSAGSWGIYSFLPGTYNFSIPTADFGNATITNATYQGNTVASGYGGTGLTTFSAANNALYSTGSSTLTAGTLPILAGGTGQTTASAAFNALSPITATGDLIIGNGTNSATRLAIGGNNTVLTSDGTTASWAAAGGGFASGTALLFYQAAAPTGWTQVTTQDNKALRVVSGTGGGTGGSVAFTTAFASQTPSGSVTTSISAVSGSVSISGGTVGDTTLNANQIPLHTHGVGTLATGNNSVDHSHTFSGGTGGVNANHTHGFSAAVAANQAFLLGAGGQVTFGDTNGVSGTGGQSADHAHGYSGTTSGQSVTHTHAISGNTGNNTTTGSSHTHGFTAPTGSFTFSSGTASSSFTGSAINLAVQYIDVIICTKN